MDGLETGAAGAARDDRGRYRPGQSGNPAGKPPGTRNRATILTERLRDDDVEAAYQIVRDKLAAGSFAAARLVIERRDPKPRGRPIAFAVRDTADEGEVLDAAQRAVTGGEISIEEGLALLRFLQKRDAKMARLRSDAVLAEAEARRSVVAERVPRAAARTSRPAASPPAPPPDPGLSPEFHLNLQARQGAPRLRSTLLASTTLARPPTPAMPPTTPTPRPPPTPAAPR